MTSDEELVIPDEQWVAHVCVASGLAHLDRPFDYLVPVSYTHLTLPTKA